MKNKKGKNPKNSPKEPISVVETKAETVTEPTVPAEPLDDMPVQTIIEENCFLKAKLEELTRKLAEAEETNQELSQAKALLSDEIVDLTKVLFEEANGMVANEVRARTQLEVSRRKLQHELDQTKDRLKVESQQLTELKQKLYQIAEENSSVSLNSTLMNGSRADLTSGLTSTTALSSKSLEYFDVLFPERRFNSKTRCNSFFSLVWGEIIRSINPNTFQSFSKLLEIIGKLDDDDVLGNPFVRSIYDNDVVPCLNFDAKPKTFTKKIVQAMFKNTCSIEKISAASPLPSPIQVSPASPGSPAAKEISLTVENTETSTINSMMSELALSFSALPDIFVLESNYKETESVKPLSSDKRYCCLCSALVHLGGGPQLYRFKLVEKDPVLLVDEPCRNKLVAAAEFYTFLRHLRRGIFANRPIIDLYFELLHYLRNMFYARTSSTSFFIQSDLESLRQ